MTKTFADVTAVDDLDLTIEDGETVVLLGPSGCGKTTCLRMIAGFERPDAGEIVFAGETLASPKAFVPPEKRHMAVVFQSYALWPHMSVYDNVAFGPTTAKNDRAEVRRRVLEVLELVQLTGYEDRYPHQLSGGQQQRVALARALVTRPRLLLLDEPLSNLDTRLREEMRGEVKRIRQLLDVTMVYVTHDQAEALSLADRLVVMNAGRIEQMGTPTAVYRRPRNGYVARALGATNIVPVDVLACHGASAHVRLFGGLDLEVDTSRLNGSFGDRAQALVSIRPAGISIGLPEAGRPRATVTEAMFFGDVVQYAVDLPTCPVPLKITGSGAHPYRPGDTLSLDVAPDAVAVLDDHLPQPSTEGIA
ncbi:ABC transporter ATP-binding protein [Pseudonocardia nigra]|uniref:ABC transporter ATP-binding protein n=1 Tax=Pseudonocardia nigra TaxID=1921578 RepID=UPI001C5E5E73|nr:ABC transporter ATP-binding protein [Pseudonocardia nigra]